MVDSFPKTGGSAATAEQNIVDWQFQSSWAIILRRFQRPLCLRCSTKCILGGWSQLSLGEFSLWWYHAVWSETWHKWWRGDIYVEPISWPTRLYCNRKHLIGSLKHSAISSFRGCTKNCSYKSRGGGQRHQQLWLAELPVSFMVDCQTCECISRSDRKELRALYLFWQTDHCRFILSVYTLWDWSKNFRALWNKMPVSKCNLNEKTEDRGIPIFEQLESTLCFPWLWDSETVHQHKMEKLRNSGSYHWTNAQTFCRRTSS